MDKADGGGIEEIVYLDNFKSLFLCFLLKDGGRYL
jgi:hypothetical protein